jgi:NADH kinase
MDGQEARTLHPGEAVKIHVSRWPVPCVERWSAAEAASLLSNGDSQLEEDERERGRMVAKRDTTGGSDEWVRDINTLLQFNAAFRNKALLRHSQL